MSNNIKINDSFRSNVSAEQLLLFEVVHDFHGASAADFSEAQLQILIKLLFSLMLA